MHSYLTITSSIRTVTYYSILSSLPWVSTVTLARYCVYTFSLRTSKFHSVGASATSRFLSFRRRCMYTVFPLLSFFRLAVLSLSPFPCFRCLEFPRVVSGYRVRQDDNDDDGQRGARFCLFVDRSPRPVPSLFPSLGVLTLISSSRDREKFAVLVLSSLWFYSIFFFFFYRRRADLSFPERLMGDIWNGPNENCFFY